METHHKGARRLVLFVVPALVLLRTAPRSLVLWRRIACRVGTGPLALRARLVRVAGGRRRGGRRGRRGVGCDRVGRRGLRLRILCKPRLNLFHARDARGLLGLLATNCAEREGAVVRRSNVGARPRRPLPEQAAELLGVLAVDAVRDARGLLVVAARAHEVRLCEVSSGSRRNETTGRTSPTAIPSTHSTCSPALASAPGSQFSIVRSRSRANSRGSARCFPFARRVDEADPDMIVSFGLEGDRFLRKAGVCSTRREGVGRVERPLL